MSQLKDILMNFIITLGLISTFMIVYTLVHKLPIKTKVDNTTVVSVPIITKPNNIDVDSSLPTNDRKLKVVEVDSDRVIELIGEVGDNVYPLIQKIQQLNRDSSAPIYMLITSPGGSILSGTSLLATMQQSKAPIYTVCQTICASMAAMTLEYGKKRYMTDMSLLMFHPGSMNADGDIDRIYSETKAIKEFFNVVEFQVAKNMNLTFDQYKNLSGQQIWVSSQDALDKHYIDEVIDFRVKRNGLDRESLFRNQLMYRKIFEHHQKQQTTIDFSW